MASVVVVLGSPRKGGNSETIAMKIAEATGKEIKVHRINDLNAKGCQACMACKKTGKCAVKDDMIAVLDDIRVADGVIVATPTYFGHASSQYRTFEDRMYSFVNGDFSCNLEPGKKVAVVVTCGSGLEGAKALADSVEGVFAGFLKLQPVGKIVCGNALAPNVAAEDAAILAQAAEIGAKF